MSVANPQKRGIRHFLKDCKQCSKKVKDQIFDNMRKSKSTQTAKILKTSHTSPSGNSIIFAATSDGKKRLTVCTETYADYNLLDSHTLDPLRSKYVDMDVNQLNTPKQFKMASALSDGKSSVIEIPHTTWHFSFSAQYSLACYCLLYTSPSPRDQRGSRMPSSA